MKELSVEEEKPGMWATGEWPEPKGAMRNQSSEVQGQGFPMLGVLASGRILGCAVSWFSSFLLGVLDYRLRSFCLWNSRCMLSGFQRVGFTDGGGFFTRSGGAHPWT